MTIQAQELAVREDLFKFVDNIDKRIENKDPYLNSIDLRLKDIALDILYGTGEHDKPEVLKTLNQIKEYTGSPDLFCPESIMKVIANLRFLMGE